MECGRQTCVSYGGRSVGSQAGRSNRRLTVSGAAEILKFSIRLSVRSRRIAAYRSETEWPPTSRFGFWDALVKMDCIKNRVKLKPPEIKNSSQHSPVVSCELVSNKTKGLNYLFQVLSIRNRFISARFPSSRVLPLPVTNHAAESR